MICQHLLRPVPISMMAVSEVQQWKNRLEEHLRACTSFWLKHSVDTEHGGYYNNLDRDGSVYDTKKHVWLQGRQVWTMSRLYMERVELQTDEYYAAIKQGAEFLMKHGPAPGNRVYFCLSEAGEPVKLQRKIFSECFYVMALSEYARVVKHRGDEGVADTIYAEAVDQYQHICAFMQDLSLVGQESFAGADASHSLSMPMIMLNVICELRCYSGDPKFEDDQAQRCLQEIKLHIHLDREMVLETVKPDGSFLDTPEGRLLNPGHAIEAAWFIIDYNRRYGGNDVELQALALKMMTWSYKLGWDQTYGGIYYFLDASGRSPEQLEWPMKLWWVHNEAMVAMLMAYVETKDEAYWQRFVEVAEWTLKRFVDDGSQVIPETVSSSTVQPGAGSWFGYLDRQGKVSQCFKGGPYKGFFHVPRCLHVCSKLLEELLAAK
eukprot:m.145913 g.145913  ORF g.145913 m.145913 type:complete len:434 (-) comp16227_c0_seq1:777-2078(-)